MKKIIAALFFTVVSSSTVAACLAPPSAHHLVLGRFGDDQGGGDGLIFSMGGVVKPVMAVANGKISYMNAKGQSGNVISIRMDNGDIFSYENLVGFSPNLSLGSTVAPGQQIGVASNRIKVTYSVATKDTNRVNAFAEMTQIPGAFNPGQLPFSFNNSVGYKTDPSPYFCQSFDIDDGQPARNPIIGGDTKSQFSALVQNPPQGGVSLGAGYDAAQVTAANMKVALSISQGISTIDFLTESDGYGLLPAPPTGAYENMSVNEMMLTEATRRFRDAEWNNRLTQVSSRALWVDYAKAIGVSNYINDAVLRKKEKVEALLAVYTSMKLNAVRAQTEESHQAAQNANARQSIK